MWNQDKTIDWRAKEVKINAIKLVYSSYRYLKKGNFTFVWMNRESLLDGMLLHVQLVGHSGFNSLE